MGAKGGPGGGQRERLKLFDHSCLPKNDDNSPGHWPTVCQSIYTISCLLVCFKVSFFAKWAGLGGPGIRKPQRRRPVDRWNCILAGFLGLEEAGWLPAGHLPYPEKIFDSESPGSSKKNNKWGTMDHFLGSCRILTPTSIPIFIALFDCALHKLVYIA